MKYDPIVEQLRTWAETLTAINRGDHGPVVLSPDAAAHLAVTIVGIREMADDLEVEVPDVGHYGEPLREP